MIEARVARPDELPICHAIRRTVFIEGQNVAEAIEVDGRDPICTHFLVLVDGSAVGTARLRITDDGIAKAERVAVLDAHRGRGIGHAVMGELERHAKSLGHHAVHLGAQTYVVAFYEARGYVAYGDEFMDANIPHRMMRLDLP